MYRSLIIVTLVVSAVRFVRSAGRTVSQFLSVWSGVLYVRRCLEFAVVSDTEPNHQQECPEQTKVVIKTDKNNDEGSFITERSSSARLQVIVEDMTSRAPGWRQHTSISLPSLRPVCTCFRLHATQERALGCTDILPLTSQQDEARFLDC